MTTEIENYRKDGFMGFVPVSELRGSTKVMPEGGGVYIVVRESDKAPEFLFLQKVINSRSADS